MKTVQPTIRSLNWDFEPIEAAARLSQLRDPIFLDSALPGRRSVSILTAEPEEVLEGHISDPRTLQSRLQDSQGTASPDAGLPNGGAFGWVDFEGFYRFGIYPGIYAFFHNEGRWVSIGSVPELPAKPLVTREKFSVQFTPQLGENEFCQMVERARDYIAAGDIYQVCLAHRQQGTFQGSPWDFYESLRMHSPAPFAAYLDLGNQKVLSASPELFLRMSGSGITTRPIKGTRPRFQEAQADEKSAYDLLTSPKEIAELIMITDLERNDLGQFCEFGSIKVRDLLKLERYAQVFHLVSTVEGRIRQGVDHLKALQFCFPGGSISGAPKKRALEIIRELEPVPRGIYTGAIGYLGFNGESRFNIAIRTVTIDANAQAQFFAGAGIVADSNPAMEWQETLHKSAGILQAAAGGNSIR